MQKCSAWCVRILLFALPIFYLPQFQRSFDFSKNIVFHSGVLFLAVVLMVQWVFQKRIRFQKARFFSPFSLIIFGFLAILYLSTLLSEVPIVSFYGNYHRTQGFLQWIFYIAFYGFLLFILTKKIIHSLAIFLMSSAGLVSFYAVLQYFGFDPLFKNFHTLFFLDRVFSTLGNPDFLGQFLAPLLPLTITLFFMKKKKEWRIVFALIVILMFLALFLSQSRAPLFGLAMAVLLFGIFLLKKNIFSRKKVMYTGIAIILFGILILWSPLRDIGPFQRFSFSIENIRSLQTRVFMWKDALQLIAERPVLGYGPDAFSLYAPLYLDPEFFYLEDNLYTFADKVHNEFLELGVSGGIFAMGLYLLLLFFLIRSYLQIPFSRAPQSFLLQGIFLALFTLIFQNFFTFSETTHSMIFFFLLASLVVILAKEKTMISLALPRIQGWVMLLFVIAASFWIFTKIVFIPVKAELYYTRSLSRPSYEEMIHELKKAAFQAPYESFYWYELMMKDPSSLPRGVHMLSQIENSTITATTWKAILLSNEKSEEAFQLFEELVAKAPDNPHLRQAYADALYRNEKWREAITQYEEFLRVAPPFWKWKFDLQNRSERDKVRYRVFFSEALDFHPMLMRLAESYEKIGVPEKAAFYRAYGEK